MSEYQDSSPAEFPSLHVDPVEHSRLLNEEQQDKESTAQIYRIDYAQRTSAQISMAEALSYATEGSTEEFRFLCFVGLSAAQVRQVRRSFRLHLVLEAECAPSIFNIKDSVLTLPDHTLLTLSELDEDCDCTISIKLILRPQFILAFAPKLPLSVSAIWNRPDTQSDQVISAVPIEDDSECDLMTQALYKVMETYLKSCQKRNLRIFTLRN